MEIIDNRNRQLRDDMEKVNMVSKDIVGNNIEKIGKLFPNCITEVKKCKW